MNARLAMALRRAELKSKICKACPTEFVPQRMAQKACSPDCALKLAVVEREARAVKKYQLETRQRKAAMKTRSDFVKEAQVEFNKFIRVRDYGKPCISCGKPHEVIEAAQSWKPGGAWDCGHFKSAGAFPELRFNEINAHRQCKGCNSGSHNHVKKARTVSADYRINLIERIGLSLVEWLEGPHKPLKATIEELQYLKKYYRERTKEIMRYRELSQ